MDSFTLEFSAHRIGGTDRYERSYIATSHVVQPGPRGYTRPVLQGRLFVNQCLGIELNGVQMVRPALWSATMALTSVDGQMLSTPRPVLFSTLPSDVALYSTHICHESEIGVFSVGLRSPQMAWAEDDLATLVAQSEPRE